MAISNSSILLSLLVMTFISCESTETGSTVIKSDDDPVALLLDYKLWRIDELADSLGTLSTSHFVFMDETAMQGTYFELSPGEMDDRTDRSLDEIYYIHEGMGTILVNGAEEAVSPGKILFAKRGSNPRFNEVETLLKVVIVTMTNSSNSSAPVWQTFEKSSIEASRDPSSNVWNPFIRFSNVILGLYMLPQSNGGDGRLVHNWQELNIITSGSSRFKMDTDEIDIERGAIFFVEEGNGHFFKSLKSDIDILILWEQP